MPKIHSCMFLLERQLTDKLTFCGLIIAFLHRKILKVT
jgi:hypothetical protein